MTKNLLTFTAVALCLAANPTHLSVVGPATGGTLPSSCQVMGANLITCKQPSAMEVSSVAGIIKNRTKYFIWFTPKLTLERSTLLSKMIQVMVP
jgi:hypothetical protein